MKICTYCLVDPRNDEIFYVGCGSEQRPRASSKFAPHEITLKNIRIKNINNDGVEPTIQILKKCKTKQEGLEWEKHYINTIGRKDLNKGPLLNETDGGGGILNASLRLRHKKSISSIGKPKSKIHCERISNALKGVAKSKEHTLKNSESHKGLKQSLESKQKKSDTMKKRLKENPRQKDSKGRFI